MKNISNWTFQNVICDNGISKVYKAVKNDGTYGVIKHLSLPINNKIAMELVNRGKIRSVGDAASYYFSLMNSEINILNSLKNNPYILNMYEAIQDGDNLQGNFYIILEYAVDVNEYFKKNGISEQDVVKLGIDICSAIEVCRSINVTHNDIKPTNIFYDGNNFKLGDFGSSTYGSNNDLVYFGTPNYLSPEICYKSPTSECSDVYSLGMVMYSLLAGHLPFVSNGVTEEEAFTRRMGGESIQPIDGISAGLMQIILTACSYNPSYRFSNAADMKKALIDIGVVNSQKRNVTVSASKLDDTISVFDNQLIASQTKLNTEISLKKDKARRKRIIKNVIKNSAWVALLLLFLVAGSTAYLFNRECDPGFINKNGRCVAGYYYCEDGFVLNKDNQCQKTIESVDAKLSYSCQAGYTLKDDVCVNTQILQPTSVYKCADGFNLNGAKCIREESIDAVVTYTCPSAEYAAVGDKCYTVSNKDATPNYYCKDSTYTLSGKYCIKKISESDTYKAGTSYTCESGWTLDGTTCKKITEPTCSGYFYFQRCFCDNNKPTNSDGKCETTKSASVTYTCHLGDTSDGKGNCSTTSSRQDKQAASVKYTCPSGYTVVGAQCTKGTDVAGKIKYNCPDGTKLVNKKCVSTISTDAVNMYVCPDGYIVSGSGCVMKEFPKAVKKYSCSRVYTLNGNKCEKYETVEAKPFYTE